MANGGHHANEYSDTHHAESEPVEKRAGRSASPAAREPIRESRGRIVRSGTRIPSGIPRYEPRQETSVPPPGKRADRQRARMSTHAIRLARSGCGLTKCDQTLADRILLVISPLRNMDRPRFCVKLAGSRRSEPVQAIDV